MKTVDKAGVNIAKYGIMIKDLGIKTYCDQAALDIDVADGNARSNSCTDDINSAYFEE